jgi:hypothetical protein
MSIDWTEYDAVNVLALPLHRWAERARYAQPNGDFDGAVRRLVYSNGTEHGFATERAEMVLELGPILRRVLFEGVRALEKDPAFEAYLGAMAAGDHEQIVELEQAEAEVGDTR